MKILYVCHRFPYPPKRGGKIRPFNMIRHLSKNHDVTVASLVRSKDEGIEGAGLRDYCAGYLMERLTRPAASARMVGMLATSAPSSMGYFFSPRLLRRIRQELHTGSYDLIFVHCSSVAQYVQDVVGIPRVLDFGDMDSQKWLDYSKAKGFPLSLGYLLEGRKLMKAEKKLAASFDYCSCTTRAELDTLRSYGAARRSTWFPNGVDHEYFSPNSDPYDRDTICFAGRMDYFPNQQCMTDFCRTTLPALQQRRPGTKLTIVGANPSPAIRQLNELPGVTVTGSVVDVRPYVQTAAVSVAPLNIARGTQNKILEAMAMGVPVVCSTKAAGGVDAIPEEHMLTASGPTEYVEAIVRLLDSEAERTRLSQAGRERMLSHHDWRLSMQRLDELIADCLASCKASADKAA